MRVNDNILFLELNIYLILLCIALIKLNIVGFSKVNLVNDHGFK